MKKLVIEFIKDEYTTLKELEIAYIKFLLKEFQENRTKTARAMGVSVRGLRDKLKRFKLVKKSDDEEDSWPIAKGEANEQETE